MSLKKPNLTTDHSSIHDPFAALRFRDYRLFTIGRILLFTGNQMQTVALGWELYERTNSPLALGIDWTSFSICFISQQLYLFRRA